MMADEHLVKNIEDMTFTAIICQYCESKPDSKYSQNDKSFGQKMPEFAHNYLKTCIFLLNEELKD